nr:hypothetical protein [Agrobacterium sp. rho-8.1]
EPVAAIKGITNGLGHAERSHTQIADRLTLQCRLTYNQFEYPGIKVVIVTGAPFIKTSLRILLSRGPTIFE